MKLKRMNHDLNVVCIHLRVEPNLRGNNPNQIVFRRVQVGWRWHKSVGNVIIESRIGGIYGPFGLSLPHVTY